MNLGSVNWSRTMVLRTLLMMPSAMASCDSLPFVEFLAMASWIPVSMISSVNESALECSRQICRIGLDVGVDEVAHIRLEWLDVQLSPSGF